ncbi:MAG: hypothetical protein Q4B35_00255 [Slackia sp.]|nr:hypothetical protein [Slackia sp.]
MDQRIQDDLGADCGHIPTIAVRGENERTHTPGKIAGGTVSARQRPETRLLIKQDAMRSTVVKTAHDKRSGRTAKQQRRGVREKPASHKTELTEHIVHAFHSARNALGSDTRPQSAFRIFERHIIERNAARSHIPRIFERNRSIMQRIVRGSDRHVIVRNSHGSLLRKSGCPSFSKLGYTNHTNICLCLYGIEYLFVNQSILSGMPFAPSKRTGATLRMRVFTHMFEKTVLVEHAHLLIRKQSCRHAASRPQRSRKGPVVYLSRAA